MTSNLSLLRKFLQSPARIGSIAPSSRSLVASLIQAVDWERTRTIVELGAGTGVVTDAIDRMRNPTSTFLCFEQDRQLRSDLAWRFPEVSLEEDAFGLYDALRRSGQQRADCIVSCLPFATMEPEARSRLLRKVHGALAPDGLFIAFQYSRQLLPYLLATYDDVDTRWVMLNLPPAFVYICRKSC